MRTDPRRVTVRDMLNILSDGGDNLAFTSSILRVETDPAQ